MSPRVGPWLLAIILSLPALCRAQPQNAANTPGSERETAEYTSLIEQALSEDRAENFVEARALFSRAHAIYPNARTLRGLAMMEFELKSYVDCIVWLEQALASTVKPLEGALRQEAEILLSRARSFVAEVAIETRPPAPGGTLLIIDEAPEARPLTRAVLFNIGDHVLRLRAPGYDEEVRNLSIKTPVAQHLVIELSPLTSSLAQPSASTRSDARPVWKNPWLWSGIGAAVVVAVVVGVVVASRNDDGGGSSGVSGDLGGIVETLRAR